MTAASITRRRFGRWSAGLAGTALASQAGRAWAEDKYPSRALRIIVPWATGTPPDVAARVVAARLPELLKQPVVVENKPGASGTIGLAELVRAPADGYTLASLHFASAAVASLYPQARLDLARDVVGLGQIEWGSNVLVVSPTLGVQSVAELVALLKKSPSVFASSGVGTPAHLAGLMFQRATGTQATHVPYNQFGQAITDVATGRVTFMVLAAPAAVPQVLGGKLKALAVTGPQRNASLKDVPTVAELQLPGMQSRTWSGLVARADTPREVVDRLARDIASVMALPEVRETLVRAQVEVPGESVEQFRELIRRDVASGIDFVKANNIRAD